MRTSARRDSATPLKSSHPSLATSRPDPASFRENAACLWRLLALALALTLAFSLTPTPGAAQGAGDSAADRGANDAGAADGGDESRLWYSVGLGAGSVRFTCDICASKRDPGATVQFGVGARANDHLDVGLEAGGWTRDDGGVRETVKRAGLRAVVRPNPLSGFHLLGGAGWVGYSAGQLGYNAFALSVGAGWDWPLTGRWSIGNRVLLDAASYGSLRNNAGSAADEVSLSVARFEVTLLRR